MIWLKFLQHLSRKLDSSGNYLTSGHNSNNSRNQLEGTLFDTGAQFDP